jgi:hypothetical protein
MHVSVQYVFLCEYTHTYTMQNKHSLESKLASYVCTYVHTYVHIPRSQTLPMYVHTCIHIGVKLGLCVYACMCIYIHAYTLESNFASVIPAFSPPPSSFPRFLIFCTTFDGNGSEPIHLRFAARVALLVLFALLFITASSWSAALVLLLISPDDFFIAEIPISFFCLLPFPPPPRSLVHRLLVMACHR